MNEHKMEMVTIQALNGGKLRLVLSSKRARALRRKKVFVWWSREMQGWLWEPNA